nr:MAG TPA: Late nodulin protein [Caudoviricetes sp.]
MNKIFKFFFIFPLILSLLFATVPDSSTVVNFFISYNPYIFNHKYMNDTNGTQQI